MLDTAFIHRRRGENIGDLACSPAGYFQFGDQASFDFKDDIPECNLAVLGGGQVFQSCVTSALYQNPLAKRRVVWGVGISDKDRRSVDFDLLNASCNLVSTRNWGVENCEFVPCVSAMATHFDNPPEPVHDVVLFYHALKSEALTRVDGIPERSNHHGTMKDAISFLASGETVVTNSYHGTYWAMCLGRKVLCLPFNQKFQHFQDNPIMGNPTDWPKQINRAERRSETLGQARALNERFYDKVRNI
ncbi:MAG: hypothetical protein ABJM43_19060 [Paracoccaceae bacterium]